MSIAVKEWQDDIIFLRKLVEGQANRSYGVQVAKLAGLPEAVVDRARDVLERLEAGAREGSGAAAALAQDLPLFSAHVPQPMSRPVADSAVEDRLRDAQPDTLSPREALDLIYELREMLRG